MAWLFLMLQTMYTSGNTQKSQIFPRDFFQAIQALEKLPFLSSEHWNSPSIDLNISKSSERARFKMPEN